VGFGERVGKRLECRGKLGKSGFGVEKSFGGGER